MRKPTFWFPTWSDTNQAVQLHKMARGMKCRIYKVEGLYYLCSENKGADQLRGYLKIIAKLLTILFPNFGATVSHTYEQVKYGNALNLANKNIKMSSFKEKGLQTFTFT